MVDSLILYLGLAITLAGILSILWPLRFLGIRARLRGLMVAAVGLLIVVIVGALPARPKRISRPTTKLDEWMPVWQFNERHQIQVNAAPDKVFEAIHAVRADEIFLFRTLIALRQCGQPGPESIMNAPETKPLLDVATQTTFAYLVDEAPREIVLGTVINWPSHASRPGKVSPEVFRKELPSGVVLATMNYLINPDANGSTVSTETRVYGNNAASVGHFAVYWRLIHPGSDIIRRNWLRAIKRRAER